MIYAYVYQMLNLFEMILSFRKEGAIEVEELMTWVEWFWETCEYPAFRSMWIGGMRDHYRPQLRSILDAGVILHGCPNREEAKEVCFLDPSGRLRKACASLRSYQGSLADANKEGEAERLFFGYLGQLLKCSKMSEYYREKEDVADDPRCAKSATRRGVPV